MQLDRIYYPIKTLGPGNRIGIWTVGCEHKCINCSNQELWEAKPEKDIPLLKIIEILESIQHHNCDVSGVTISGGEPFLQTDKLSELVLYLRNNITDDILIYSGFTIEELKTRGTFVVDILQNIAVLVDGKYVDELNDNLPLRGSSNQRVHLLNDNFAEKYSEVLNTTRTVQNVYYDHTSISFGIPQRNYRELLNEGLKKKGVLSGGK